MKGDIAFAGFMLTAEEWQAFDSETRAALVAVATRRHASGTEPPWEMPPVPQSLAEGSGPLECDDYVELFDADDVLEA